MLLMMPFHCPEYTELTPNVPLGETVTARLKQFSAMNKFKKRALRVVAEQLSVEEMAGIKQMFHMMDTHNKGNLSFEELKVGLHTIGETVPDPDVRMLMDVADDDGNGTLDYGEFVTVSLQLKRISSEEHLNLAFTYFDKNQSGYIEIDELRDALAEDAVGADCEQVIHDIIRDVDLDKKWDFEVSFKMGLPGHDMAVALVNPASLDLGSQLHLRPDTCALMVSVTDSFLSKRNCDVSSNSAIGSARMNLSSPRWTKSIRIRTQSNKSTNPFFEPDGAPNYEDWPAFNNGMCSSPGCISPSFLLFDELRGSDSSSRLEGNACSSSSTTNTFCTSSPASRTNGLRKLRCHAADIEARHEEDLFFVFSEDAWSSSSGCLSGLSPSFICFDELRTRDGTFDKSLGIWEVHVDPLFSQILSSYEVIGNSSCSVPNPLDEKSMLLGRKLAALHRRTRSDAFLEVKKVQRVNSIHGKEDCASLLSSELTCSRNRSLCGRTSCTDLLPQDPLSDMDEVLLPTGLDNLDGLEDDGPLFWPFDQNCFRYDELNWDLCISPSRKNRVDACMTQTFRRGKNTNLQLRRSAIHNSRRKNETCRPNDLSVFDYGSTKENRPTLSPNGLAKIQTRDSICNQGDKMAADKQTCSSNSVLKTKKGVKSRLGVQSSNCDQDICCNVPTNGSFADKPGEHSCGDLIHGGEHVDQLLELAVKDSQVLEQIIFWPIVESMSVEALVGMEEFDGHEGIDTELTGNQFSLEDFTREHVCSVL